MIEQEVRDMLQSKVRNAPALDEPPAKVLRRARGRRALNATGVVAALAVIAVGSLIGVRSLGTSRVEPVTRVVRWVELEAFKGHPAPTRPCAARDFTFKAYPDDNATPETVPAFLFSPTYWTVSCKLDLGSDAARVRLVDDAGRDMDVRVRPGALPVEVWGSASTSLSYDWTNYCGPATRTIRYEISLPTGEKVTSSAAAKLPRCTDRTKDSTINASLDNGPAQLVGIFPGEGPMAKEFSITLQAPETVRQKTFLRYRAVLTNITDHDVSIRLCPDVGQELVGKMPDGGEHHANGGYVHLNCAGAGNVIRRGQSVAFEMRIEIGTIPVGAWEIVWYFATGAEPARAPVFIIPA